MLAGGGFDQLGRGAHGEAVAVAAVGDVVENAVVLPGLGIVAEDPDDGIAGHGAEAHHPAGNGAARQGFGDAEGLAGDALQAALLGGGGIQKNIHTDIAGVCVLPAPEDVAVVQLQRPPDAAGLELPRVAADGIGLEIEQDGVLDLLHQAGDGDAVLGLVGVEGCAVAGDLGRLALLVQGLKAVADVGGGSLAPGQVQVAAAVVSGAEALFQLGDLLGAEKGLAVLLGHELAQLGLGEGGFALQQVLGHLASAVVGMGMFGKAQAEGAELRFGASALLRVLQEGEVPGVVLLGTLLRTDLEPLEE